MKIKGLLFGLMMVLGSLAHAEDSATSTTSTNIWDKLKKSPFSMSYLNDAWIRAKGANGLTTDHYLYLNYKIDKYHKLTLKPIFRTTIDKAQKAQGDYHTELYTTEFRFSRSAILTEDKHGVNASFMLRNYFANDNTRKARGYDSYHYAYGIFSKTFGKYSLSSTPFILVYNRNADSKTTGAATHVWSASLGHGYQFNDNFGVSYTNTYYSYRYDNAEKNTEYLLSTLSLDYAFNSGVSVSLYYEGYILNTTDGNLFSSYRPEWTEEAAIGTLVSLPIF